MTEHRMLRGGKLAAGSYEEREQQLLIEFVDGSRRVYKGVPGEVWRRLLAAPNPGSFFEDRIADEYPNQPAGAVQQDQARARLDALFGPAPDEPSDR
ncbi:MAG: KTSC domain-containing protein [Quisquiliibacterium sp.]